MRVALLILLLLTVTPSTTAQRWSRQESSVAFDVQLQFGAPPDNDPLLLGPVFQPGNPSPIGAWIESIQYPPIASPCAYCRRWRPSRFRQLTAQTPGLKAPNGSSLFITFYVTVDGARITRTGRQLSAGQPVLIEDDNNQWQVLSGSGLIAQDDNGEWRLSFTLVESR